MEEVKGSSKMKITEVERGRMLNWVERMYAREIEEEDRVDKDTVDSDYYLVEQIVRLIEEAL